MKTATYYTVTTNQRRSQQHKKGKECLDVSIIENFTDKINKVLQTLVHIHQHQHQSKFRLVKNFGKITPHHPHF
jgi:hypothetical protein